MIREECTVLDVNITCQFKKKWINDNVTTAAHVYFLGYYGRYSQPSPLVRWFFAYMGIKFGTIIILSLIKLIICI